MTEPAPGERGARPAGRRRRPVVAPASRILVAGLSVGAAFTIVTALAVAQPPEGPTEVVPSGATVATEPVTTTSAAPPPTTIVINRIYVPVPVDGGSGARTSGSSGAGASSSASSPAAAVPSAPAPTAAAPAPSAAPAPKPTAPAATTRAS